MITRFCNVVIVIAVSCALARSQPASPGSDWLSKKSDVIVIGKVGKLVSEWDETRSRIQTRVTIAVDEMLKGPSPARSIEIIVPGGEVDGVGEWYSHMARFESQENVVVFARSDDKGLLRVSGGQQGKFSIHADAVTGAKMITNIGSLDEFRTHIKSVLQQVNSTGK